MLLFLPFLTSATTGNWSSKVTGSNIAYKTTDAQIPKTDYFGNYQTIIYLKNVGFKNLSKTNNTDNVKWLLSQGYRVIEIDYNHNINAISPFINADIIAINDSLANGSFIDYNNCSRYQSYVLFEGYRIAQNVPYFIDNPTVYNKPTEYTIGDTLYMDIIYPANSSVEVPVILSFSYCNSYATYDSKKRCLTNTNKNQRLNLGNTLAGFNDSFLEGAPANGIAWAIADHPKYCPWGGGKPINGANDAYKSYQTNPDATQKVKSAIRTLRAIGDTLKLSGKIGIYGFSRGSTAGSLAIGDRQEPTFEEKGFNNNECDDVQAAALGSGVFDYTLVYNASDDGDSNLETRCAWVWGSLSENYSLWKTMGASYLVETSATSPVLFFYNTDDAPYYQDQIAHLKAKLDSLKVPTSTLINYGKGHSVPQTPKPLSTLYQFFNSYLTPPNIR